MSFWMILRWLLVITSIVLTAFVTWYAISERREAEKQKIGTLEFQEPVKAAIDNKLSTARTFLQTALVIAGALWALLIGGKDQIWQSGLG